MHKNINLRWQFIEHNTEIERNEINDSKFHELE
jgi:hypothetical protein